jgi:hypothetical protein
MASHIVEMYDNDNCISAVLPGDFLIYNWAPLIPNPEQSKKFKKISDIGISANVAVMYRHECTNQCASQL